MHPRLSCLLLLLACIAAPLTHADPGSSQTGSGIQHLPQLQQHIARISGVQEPTQLNLLAAAVSRDVMHQGFAAAGWQHLPGEMGVNGLDSLYIRSDSQGTISEVIVVKSRYETTTGGVISFGHPIGHDWTMANMERLMRLNPQDERFSQASQRVGEGAYRAYQWHMDYQGERLVLEVNQVSSVGAPVAGQRYIASNETARHFIQNRTIQLNQPANDFQRTLAQALQNSLQPLAQKPPAQ